MKITKTASGKQTVKISKSEWKNIGKKAGWMKKTAQYFINRNDGKTVLIPDEVIQHIQQTHSEIGKGSVFNGTPNLQDVASSAPVAPNQRPLYQISGASGYNLVMPIDEARQLPDATETTATKEEDVDGSGTMQSISVPAIQTSAPLSQFATSEAYAIILQTTPDSIKFLPSSLQQNENVQRLAAEGTLFTLVTAFPGNPNVPRTSEWNGQWAVIIPDSQTQNAQQPQQQV